MEKDSCTISFRRSGLSANFVPNCLQLADTCSGTHLIAGHTSGSLGFVLEAGETHVVFSGDTCKDAMELLSKAAHMTYDAGSTPATIE